MKNLYIFLLLLIGVGGFGQTIPGVDIKLSPNGVLETIFDKNGNKYTLSDIKAGEDKIINNTLSKSTLLCNSGIFDLYFETGSGMESATDPIEIQRRTVVCQVYNDLSNFIISPLQNAGNTTRVKIWVRKISNIPNVPSNALGLATAFYNLPQNTTLGFGGIADNEVWKTITSGKDSYINVTSPLVSTNSTPNPSGNFYHGMMAFNFTGITWNTNLAINSPAGQYDLYSVVLHEVTHALGFVSLMNANGQSVFGTGFNYFSRYDKFLKNNAGTQSLITNGTACSSMYNYNFNTTSLTTSILHPSTSCLTNQTTCATAVKFAGTSTVPLYTTNCFEQGSSLSHFEDLCVAPNVNDAYFAMSNAIATGKTKRFLKFQERNALGDIGYKLNTTYGNNTAVFGSFNNYGGTITTGVNVAGINDGINTNGTFSYSGNTSTAITINSSTDPTKRILANDTNVTSFECLQDVFSTSTFSAISGTSITNVTFTSTVSGLHLLRYVPINATGQKGNITYIYVYVNETTSCAVPTSCNLVLNGDFEQYSSIPNFYSQLNKACGWKQISAGTPDYFHSLTNSIMNIPCNELGFQNVKNNIGNAYAGTYNFNIWNNSPWGTTPYNEPLGTKLVTPLLPNKSYQLSYDISLAEGASLYAIKFQAYLSNYEINLSGVGNIPIDNPNMLFTNPSFYTISDDGTNITNGWKKVSINFTTGATSGEQFLYLGGLKNVEYLKISPANQVAGCNYAINNYENSFNGMSYYYIDNVSLISLDDANFDIPNSLCVSYISDLSVYLSTTPTNGVFTGNGVVNNNGIYSFNAAIAGVGTHTITYTFTNNNGCSVSISDTIIVNASNISTFNAIAPICSGAVLSDLPTTSTNGVTGTWLPALNNTATTTYTFTPTTGQCATTTSLTITVLSANDPSCVTNPCLPNLTLNTPEGNSPIIYKRLNWIETNTNYTTSISQDVKMKAGDFINLKSGTHIKAGSLYLGKIEACTATSKTSIQETKISEIENKSIITIYPNPTKENVTITSTNSKIKSIAISSIEGKTFFIKNSIYNEQYLLDASNYQKGIYIITIETIDGKIVRQKLIKN